MVSIPRRTRQACDSKSRALFLEFMHDDITFRARIRNSHACKAGDSVKHKWCTSTYPPDTHTRGRASTAADVRVQVRLTSTLPQVESRALQYSTAKYSTVSTVYMCMYSRLCFAQGASIASCVLIQARFSELLYTML